MPRQRLQRGLNWISCPSDCRWGPFPTLLVLVWARTGWAFPCHSTHWASSLYADLFQTIVLFVMQFHVISEFRTKRPVGGWGCLSMIMRAMCRSMVMLIEACSGSTKLRLFPCGLGLVWLSQLFISDFHNSPAQVLSRGAQGTIGIHDEWVEVVLFLV